MSARIAAAALGLALLAGAGQAQTPATQDASPDIQGDIDPAAADGGHLFREKCAMCHREANMVTGMGTALIGRRDPAGEAMLERRASLNEALVMTVVRTGIGNMPRMSRAEVSDAQLTAIARYLVASAETYEPDPVDAGEGAPLDPPGGEARP